MNNSKRTRSSVWNFFHKEDTLDGPFTVCTIAACRTKIKQTGGNTSNMLKHLKTKHMKEYEECAKEIKENEEKRRKTTTNQQPSEPTIQQTLSRSQLYSKDSIRRKNIDESLIYMIATDLQPIAIVEDKGFKNLLSTLDSRYQPPSRRTVMSTQIPVTYQNLKTKLLAELNNTSHVSLTTDIWTSLQTTSYCCVTVHYITETWELKSAVLETFEFSTDHTAEHIAAELQRVAASWNIGEKVVCVVTDNASNMVAAISKTPWRHLPCFAHSLNLVVQDSITRTSDISDLQKQCKDIVSHFHRSAKSTTKLREVQKQLINGRGA